MGQPLDRRGQLRLTLGLVVARMTHVRPHDRLELVGLEPGSQFGQQSVEGSAAQRPVDTMTGRDVNVDLVHRQLEVDGPRRVACLTLVLAAREVHPHEQPAKRPENCSDDQRQDAVKVHLTPSWISGIAVSRPGFEFYARPRRLYHVCYSMAAATMSRR